MSKKILVWQDRNNQDFAESFPENSLQISRKSNFFWFGLKNLGCPRTIVFFLEISSISGKSIGQTLWYQVSLERLKFKVRVIFGNLLKPYFQIFSKFPDSSRFFSIHPDYVETDRFIKELTDIWRDLFKHPISQKKH